MMEYVTVGHVAWNTDVGWNMLVDASILHAYTLKVGDVSSWTFAFQWLQKMEAFNGKSIRQVNLSLRSKMVFTCGLVLERGCPKILWRITIFFTKMLFVVKDPMFRAAF